MIEINIYTDGASKSNPGSAGYGWVILIGDKKYYKSYGVEYATNNQMELRSVVDAITFIADLYDSEGRGKGPRYDIKLYSDSQYVCNAINKKWIDKWIKEDYKKIKNPELWKELVDQMIRIRKHLFKTQEFHFIWVKGHNGNEYNEEADSLAQMACGHEGIVMQGVTQVENNLIS